MSEKPKTIIGSAVLPFRFVFLIWFIFALELFYGVPLSDHGLFPRVAIGLLGVITAPLLHADLQHLASNTIPLIVLGATLFYFYPKLAVKVFVRSYIVTGLLVWSFGRFANHIGASGLIYGIAAFLITFGLVRRDVYSSIISFFVIVFYGSLIYGIFPTNNWVSWESHLAGALVGLGTSLELKNKKYQ